MSENVANLIENINLHRHVAQPTQPGWLQRSTPKHSMQTVKQQKIFKASKENHHHVQWNISVITNFSSETMKAGRQ